jgi:hypothetical protein
MRISSTVRLRRHGSRVGFVALVHAFAVPSAFALSSGPSAFVPANDPRNYTVSVIDLSTPTNNVVTSFDIVHLDNDNPNNGTDIGNSVLFGVAVSRKTGMFFPSMKIDAYRI